MRNVALRNVYNKHLVCDIDESEMIKVRPSGLHLMLNNERQGVEITDLRMCNKNQPRRARVHMRPIIRA